ncbi:MAG: hypothetical protein ABEH59_00450 [Halobacteriales archaeon]
MRRRALLGLLGTALSAGCAATGDTETEPTATPAPVPGISATATPASPTGSEGEPNQRNDWWSLVEFGTTPVTAALTKAGYRTPDGAEVTLRFGRTATDEHPATIRGVFRNANPFANTFRLNALALFQPVPTAWPGGRPGDADYTVHDELVLAPTDRHDIALTVPELTLASDDRWRLAGDVNGPWLPETKALEPEETFRFEYAVAGRPQGRGFPRDSYHFEGHGEREVRIDIWSTASPGPGDGSQFGGPEVSPLPDTERMAWFHEAGAETPVYLRPSAERVELPAKIDFTLVNHSRDAVAGNPYFWRLWKQVDDSWFHIAPVGWPLPLVRIPPGGRHESTLAAFATRPVDCEGGRAVGHLGEGHYAYEIGIGRDDVTHAALVGFEASSVTIEPTDGLDVSRDGAEVRVNWPRRADDVPGATLTLTRSDAAERRLIPEQVMQSRNVALRNTLPFLDADVDRVRLMTDRNTVSRGARTDGYEDGTFRFRLRGETYAASAQFGTGG